MQKKFLFKSFNKLNQHRKIAGKKTLTELLGNLIYKAQGKPVLVTADDPRNEYIQLNLLLMILQMICLIRRW